MALDPDNLSEQIKEEPESSGPWLALIHQSEKALEDYQTRCDRIERLYADTYHLANASRDGEFALFWSNVEVLKPSIYARPPVPVVQPKFKDRRPLYRRSSELLERSVSVAFDLTSIDDVMISLRDDLAIIGRGAAWVRYETKAEADAETERVCVEWLHRRDFGHEPARTWPEVGYVWRRAWMTFDQMVDRFKDVDKDVLRGADFQVRLDDKDKGTTDGQEKAGVYEIWHKQEKKVVWVTEGIPTLLDSGAPHLNVEGFFPCPKPAYATRQPSSLVPVPDVMFYKDQLEEINVLTARIMILSQSLQVRGFYPAGAGELSDAMESANSMVTNNKVLIGVSNWAAFGNGAPKDTIVWWPTDQIATTIVQCVELRRQLIEDVYQLMGISDIQRGSTEAEETATAQQIKTQNGSVRVRDKQNELVRIAKDLVRIAAEIMAENFSKETLADMCQMELPTDAEIKKQVKEIETAAKELKSGLEAQMARAQTDPNIQQMIAQDPEKAQQAMQQMEQQAQAQLQGMGAEVTKLQETVTIEQVMKFLHDNKIRPFVLDIETDSTIYADENAEKQRRAEFLQAFGGLLAQVSGLVQTVPESAGFAAELVRFGLAPFRAGRTLDAAIDEFADSMIQRAQNPQQGDGEQKGLIEAQKMLAQAEQVKAQAAMQNVEAKAAKDQAENQRKMMELEQKTADSQRKGEIELATTQAKLQEAQAKVRKTEADIEHVNAQIAAIFAKMGMDAKTVDLNEFKTVTDVEFRAQDQQRQDVQTATQVEGQSFEQQQRLRGEDRSDRQQSFTEQQTQNQPPKPNK